MKYDLRINLLQNTQSWASLDDLSHIFGSCICDVIAVEAEENVQIRKSGNV